MRVLMVGGILLALAGCRNATPTPWDAPNAEPVRVLRAADSPYFIIYHPAVDLAKKP